jgi:hypothetical protein
LAAATRTVSYTSVTVRLGCVCCGGLPVKRDCTQQLAAMEAVMARVVAVHGIAQQFNGESVLHHEWCAPMRDGMRLAGGGDLAPDDLRCVS